MCLLSIYLFIIYLLNFIDLFMYLSIYSFIYLLIYSFIYLFIHSFPFENVHLPAACGWYMSVYDTRCHQSKATPEAKPGRSLAKSSWAHSNHYGFCCHVERRGQVCDSLLGARLQVLEGGFSVVDFIVAQQTW